MSHHFSSTFFTGLPTSLSVSELTLVAESASRYRLVIYTYGKMPRITRRIRTLSFEDFFARFPAFLSRRLCPLGPEPFDNFLPSVCACAFGAREDDCACCPR